MMTKLIALLLAMHAVTTDSGQRKWISAPKKNTEIFQDELGQSFCYESENLKLDRRSKLEYSRRSL